MSGFDYRSRSGYEDSHTDHFPGGSIISYDATRRSRTYVGRTELRVPATYKYPNSQVKVKRDPSTDNYIGPREIGDLFSQILDEVNGPPGLATNSNPHTYWDRHSSPVKVYPSRDDGFDYQSQWSSETHGGYEAPRQWDRSRRPVYDHEAPKNQWGNSSLGYRTPRDHEIPKNQWDHEDYSPKNQSLEMLKDHEDPNRRWGNSVGKLQSPRNYEIPSSHWDRLSIYDHPLPNGSVDHFPQNYGTHSNQHDRSSNLVYNHPPSGNQGGVSDSRWGNSLMKPESPNGYGAPNNRENFSSPIHDYALPTYYSGRVPDVPSNRWGNSLMKPQSPKGHRVSNNQWDRSSSPTYDHTLPTHNTGEVSRVPSSQWGNSLMKPQSPKGHGVPDYQWDRSSSLVHDHPPPTNNNNKSGEVLGVPSSQWDNSKYPRPSKDHGVPINQWERSSSLSHDYPPPSRNTSGVPNVPNNRWGNSSTKPQSPKDHGVTNNPWDRSSNTSHDPSLPTRNTGGVPNDRWGSTFVKPQSPKDHGVPKHEWDRSPSPFHDYPPPDRNTSGVPDIRWPNSPVKSQSRDKQSSFFHDPPAPSGNVIKVPNSRGSDPNPKPHSPRGYNHENSPSPARDHLLPTSNTVGVPNNRLGSSTLKPQSTKVTTDPHDERIGNINFQINKPVDYSIDHQPKEFENSNLMKPSGIPSSSPSQARTPLDKVTNNTGETMQKPKIDAGALPEYATSRSTASRQPRIPPPASEVLIDFDSAKAATRYGGQNYAARPSTGKDLKRTITSNDAIDKKYNGSLMPS